MVRFIIIPIFHFLFLRAYLHSNMVRFIIHNVPGLVFSILLFTFQYGQIYYFYFINIFPNRQAFTFQYGQIYYYCRKRKSYFDKRIYIPIWLDLLYFKGFRKVNKVNHLHSNMVRFIIIINKLSFLLSSIFTFQYGQIYYLVRKQVLIMTKLYLHSNMVRFIIKHFPQFTHIFFLFTFQYGQIYYDYQINVNLL